MLKQSFTDIGISKVYSSPLQRCQLLANDLFPKSSIIDRRLMEINFGLWEMRPWVDVSKTELDLWASNLETFNPPNGESLQELDRRVQAFIQDVVTCEMGGKIDKVAIICHAGVIRCLLSYLMKMPLNTHLNWQVDYGSVSKIIVEDQFVRLCYSNKLH